MFIPEFILDEIKKMDKEIDHLIHPSCEILDYYLCGAKRDPNKPIEPVALSDNICENCIIKWRSIAGI